MGFKRSVIVGTGSYLPDNIVTNDDMAKRVDTSDEWIVQRTGIRQRHFAAEDELTSDLGYQAAKRALDNAGLKPSDIDLIILATATPDYTFPGTAVAIQKKLGLHSGAAFDLQAVCSGFIFALSTADAYILSGKAQRILVIGAETFSRILDWNDRTTCVLFGDGAGAVVVESHEFECASDAKSGILTSQLRSDGDHIHKLYVDGGPSFNQQAGHIRMKGKEVFKHAVSMISDVITASYEATGYNSNDLDWFIPHQANQRIIESSAKKLDIAENKIILTVSEHGNTSAASIPLAIDKANQDGKLKKGDLVLLEAMGGGFTWGAIMLHW